jgi:undecaprenyl-diphosphatase
MALFLHIKRDDAARFAFLLGTPAFVGAALLKASDLSGQSANEWGQLVAGLVASAVVGFLVIHFLLQFLRTRTLLTFVIYRYVVAAITLLLLAVR